MKTKQTPLPWKVVMHTAESEYGPEAATLHPQGAILQGVTKADAAFVERAVNAHEELLQALKDVLETMYADPTANVDMITRCSTTVKNAIAKAEGK